MAANSYSREWSEVSRLYGDGFLLLSDGVADLKEWIQNHDAADHRSVRCLELHCQKLENIGDESIGIFSELTHLFVADGFFNCLPSSFISTLPNLQRLELHFCPQLQGLPPNLGDLLTTLTFLSLNYCSSIKSLPNSIVNLPNLTTLHLKHCDSLTELPAVPSLVELVLDYCSSIQSLPQPLLCNNLQRLHLIYCQSLSLTEFPFPDLRVLKIIDCDKIQSLPRGLSINLHLLCCSQHFTNLTRFQNLTHLTLHNSDFYLCKHKELPINFGALSQLLFLNIEDTLIKWLPWSITKLSNLRLLLLPTHFILETLPPHLNDSLVISVQHTHVRKTWKHLKTEITTFSMPITLTPGLLEEAQFPSTPKYLQCSGDPRPWVQKSNGLHLFVEDRDFHGYMMHWIGELPQLTHLYISDASLRLLPLKLSEKITHLSFTSCYFYDDIIMPCLENISTLRSLKLLGCKNMPAHIMDFLPVSLTHFSLESEDDNQPLPDSYMAYIRKLSHLNTLELYGFTALQLSLLNMNNLAKLKVTNCSKINSLPTALQHLEIIHSKVQCQYQNCSHAQLCFNQLINLKILSVTCHDIEVLPSIARHKNLQQLLLKDCFNLKKLPPDLDELVELRTLDVSGTRIKSLPAGSISKLQKLQHLVVPKCFIYDSLSKNFQHKVAEDVTDGLYYEDADYYNPFYDSTEDNKTTSGSVETGNQVVSQESWHNIIPEQASRSRPSNPLPDATQVHEGSHFSGRTDPVDNVVFSSQNLEMQNLPTGNEYWVAPVAHNSISDYNVTDGHHFANEIQQVHHADRQELEDFHSNGRINAVGESSFHARCNLQDREMQLLDSINSDCEGYIPNDIVAKSSSNTHETNWFGESNQQGYGVEQMDTINLENEHRDPPCDTIKDKNHQSVDVKHKKTQKIEIPEEFIRQYMSENMTLEDAAIKLKISRSTMKRRLKECGITWSTNPRKKQHQDTKNKEYNSRMSSSESNSSQFNSVVPSTSAGEDNRAEHIEGSCCTFDVKATYKEDIVRIYKLPSSSSIDQLKEKVGEKLGLEGGKFKMKFLDEFNDWIVLSCNSDLEHALHLSKSSPGISVVNLLVNPET